MAKIRGNKYMNGSYGEFWANGALVMEVKQFEAKITFDREDVGQSGTMDIDSKIIGAKGEGTVTVKKVFSRFMPEVVEALKKGEDIRWSFMGKLDDPDSYGAEYVNIENAWFNELILMAFENNTIVENEFPFGFTPSDVDLPKLIEVQ